VAGPARPGRAVLGDLVPPAVRRAGWLGRTLATALVGVLIAALPVAVVAVVRALGGTGRAVPAGDGGQTSAGSLAGGATGPATAGGPGWLEIRTRRDVTLGNEQSIDLDTGNLSSAQDPGRDLTLGQHGGRLSAHLPGGLSLLETSGPPSALRCATSPPERWDDTLNELHAVAAGRNICVATTDHRNAMITIDQPPDSVIPALRFHYTLWERR
jgi:hypothetical protein